MKTKPTLGVGVEPISSDVYMMFSVKDLAGRDQVRLFRKLCESLGIQDILASMPEDKLAEMDEKIGIAWGDQRA